VIVIAIVTPPEDAIDQPSVAAATVAIAAVAGDPAAPNITAGSIVTVTLGTATVTPGTVKDLGRGSADGKESANESASARGSVSAA
jgi:hypothetical protein